MWLQQFSVTKLFRSVSFRRWKKRLCPLPGVSADGVRVHHAVQFANTTPCVCYSLVLWLASQHFHAHHGNHPLVWASVYSSTCLHLSLHTMVVKPPITLIFVSPYFNLIIFPKLLGIPFLLGLIIPQQFIITNCKSSTLEMRISGPCTNCVKIWVKTFSTTHSSHSLCSVILYSII